jgi:hypothetical protein
LEVVEARVARAVYAGAQVDESGGTPHEHGEEVGERAR